MNDYIDVNFFDKSNNHETDSERAALVDIDPQGMIIRHPPRPDELSDFLTADSQLFQTIHMGAAVVDNTRWMLVVDGLVSNPFSLSLAQLKKLPVSSITTFHECYGSPLKPPTTPLWRIGNVTWTGVRLSTILAIAQPSATAKYIWSEGLEHGKFATITADRYQKDLPMEKALQPEVLLAYAMNGEPLCKERGYPVRLCVPGWFGTNSTKWICRLSAQDRRAPSPFTTTLYNEIDPEDPDEKRMRPVWAAEVNSMICCPRPDQTVSDSDLQIWGRAWGCAEIKAVDVSINEGETWLEAKVEPRKEFEWQRFEATVTFPAQGQKYTVVARAVDCDGKRQPLSGRRNHVHSVKVHVI